MGKLITDYWLYQKRFIIGYTLMALTIIGLLFVAGVFIPGGLSKPEMDSVVASDAASISFESFKPESVIDLPYHLLQHASISLFGVSNLSIKLPSLVLGALSSFGVFL